jgi:porin
MTRSKHTRLVAAACVISAAFAQPSMADQGSRFAAWLREQTATGNWGGIRSRLEDDGITVSLTYTADFAGNVSGGQTRGSTYAGFASTGLAVDAERLLGLAGTSLTANGSWNSGRSLSADDIGNVLGVQEAFGEGVLYLGQVTLSQSLFDDTVTLQAGRLIAGDVFATSPLWDYYVNGGIDDNLGSISANIFFPGIQAATWAVRAFYQPTKEWGFIAGAYNADPTVAEPGKHGTDFSLDTSKGQLAIAQVTYQHHQSRDDGGLSGSVALGGYFESSRFAVLDNPTQTQRGNYGAYFYVDQMLYRGDWLEYVGLEHLRGGATYAARAKHPYIKQAAIAKDRPQGPSIWAAVYGAPQPRINPQPLQVAGGLLYHGLVGGRDRDVTAVGVISAIFSDQLQGQGAETVLEANHRFQIGPWLYVTPDFQYVIHPNGSRSMGNAAVFGVEVSLTL